MHALQTQQSSTPQPAILTPLAGHTASSVRDRTDPPRACYGMFGCPYHRGCAAYARIESDPEATRIATCWIKGHFPLLEVA